MVIGGPPTSPKHLGVVARTDLMPADAVPRIEKLHVVDRRPCAVRKEPRVVEDHRFVTPWFLL